MEAACPSACQMSTTFWRSDVVSAYLEVSHSGDDAIGEGLSVAAQ